MVWICKAERQTLFELQRTLGRHYGRIDKPHSRDASPSPIQTSSFGFFFLTVNPKTLSAQKQNISESILPPYPCSQSPLLTQTIDLILMQLQYCRSQMSTVSPRNRHVLISVLCNRRYICCIFQKATHCHKFRLFQQPQPSKAKTTMTPGIVMEIQPALRMTKSCNDSLQCSQ